jgi:hypothetical protein
MRIAELARGIRELRNVSKSNKVVSSRISRVNTLVFHRNHGTTPAKVRGGIMNIRLINLWKYWKNGYAHDIYLVDISLYDTMTGGMRVVVLNVGFEWSWKKS